MINAHSIFGGIGGVNLAGLWYTILYNQSMEWKILEYETTRGERPVTEFIKKQKQKTPQKEIKTARQRYLSLT